MKLELYSKCGCKDVTCCTLAIQGIISVERSGGARAEGFLCFSETRLPLGALYAATAELKHIRRGYQFRSQLCLSGVKCASGLEPCAPTIQRYQGMSSNDYAVISSGRFKQAAW